MARPRRILKASRNVAWLVAMSAALGVYLGARSWSSTSLSGAATNSIPTAVEPIKTTASPEVIAKRPSVRTTPPGPPAELFGAWTDEFHGTRTFRFHEDGTGVMSLKLDTLGRLVYGPKLEFDLAWTWSDGGLDLKMTGGRPEAQTKSAAAVFGDNFRYLLLEAGSETLKIKAADDGTEYELDRVRDIETAGTGDQTLR